VNARPELLLAIDQGTSSTRAAVFDRELRPVAAAARAVERQHPQPGWVETDPAALLESVVESVTEVLETVGGPARIAATGLDNQGETVIAWDDEALRPLAPGIVWQCRRSLPIVEALRAEGQEPWIRAATGLPLDPYFSAGKLAWLLHESDSVRAAAASGHLRFGTVDAWLTANLSEARPGGWTDHSTASRTQLFDVHRLAWGPELLDVFGIPAATLPALRPTAGRLGSLTHAGWRGSVPLTAMVCDQQAALAGHGRSAPGGLKVTYGTGAFVVAHAGGAATIVDGIETSVGWTGVDGATSYILQGGVLSAGSFVDWLRDDLGLLAPDEDLDRLARTVPDAAGVRILPSLSGVGAPWYRPSARGVIAGLDGGVTRAHVARAAIDGICHRVADVVEAMLPGLPTAPRAIRVDGGLTASDELLQRQADVLGLPVERATVEEATGLGTALLAGIGAGLLDPEVIHDANAVAQTFPPTLSAVARARQRLEWRAFLERASEL
jgi:glycerol kinase